jgi:hypothetical protein
MLIISYSLLLSAYSVRNFLQVFYHIFVYIDVDMYLGNPIYKINIRTFHKKLYTFIAKHLLPNM